MSTIRIDEKHARLLDRLVAHITLQGKKMNKKALVGKLIEDAVIGEGIPVQDELRPLEEDPAWTGLQDTFKLGIRDLSEKVDKLLYQLDGEG
ncbi:MAG: hypothetical protein RBG13Loki_3504 [Promethearchaeota archaeon CR_4]|nr:MAG: hypothetical protein RBG13Loki_3504 [Candidatus Lokiarchaeota archaeon CR_4]